MLSTKESTNQKTDSIDTIEYMHATHSFQCMQYINFVYLPLLSPLNGHVYSYKNKLVLKFSTAKIFTRLTMYGMFCLFTSLLPLNGSIYSYKNQLMWKFMLQSV